jgi:hypothetical protein
MHSYSQILHAYCLKAHTYKFVQKTLFFSRIFQIELFI